MLRWAQSYSFALTNRFAFGFHAGLSGGPARQQHPKLLDVQALFINKSAQLLDVPLATDCKQYRQYLGERDQNYGNDD
jgi:hypothetical protein